jgi:hypothetical protein
MKNKSIILKFYKIKILKEYIKKLEIYIDIIMGFFSASVDLEKKIFLFRINA